MCTNKNFVLPKAYKRSCFFLVFKLRRRRQKFAVDTLTPTFCFTDLLSQQHQQISVPSPQHLRYEWERRDQAATKC